MLIAEKLQKTYRKRRVVNDASFQVDAAKVVGLLGPNGAGKTTSFYMTIGLVRPDQGRILLDGTDITRLPVHRRAQLGLS